MVYPMPTTQCSRLAATLPASLGCALALMTVPATALTAQTMYRVTRQENFRQEPKPDATLLASVTRGTLVPGDSTRDGWIRVMLDGWIWGQSVHTDHRNGYDLSVSASSGENLRAQPNTAGTIEARLLTGFLLRELGRQGDWVHVRREGWMWSQSLATAGGASSATTVSPASTPESDAAPSLDRVLVQRRAPLLTAPDGDTLATAGAEMPGRIVARSGDWVRVAVEAWVRGTDVHSAADGVLTGVSAAEVRSRPRDFEGKMLQWTLQFISLQNGDDVRPDIPANRPYFLARGPLPETGFVYVLLDSTQAKRVATLQPLSTVTVIGRLRTARSQYLGNPILDLVDLAVPHP